MAAKVLILVMEEGSGRILAVRISSMNRIDYDFERLIDHFQLGASEENVTLFPIAQTFAIRLKRVTPDPKIQTDQDVALPRLSSPRPLL